MQRTDLMNLQSVHALMVISMMEIPQNALSAITNAPHVQAKLLYVSSAKEIDLDLFVYVQVKPMMMV